MMNRCTRCLVGVAARDLDLCVRCSVQLRDERAEFNLLLRSEAARIEALQSTPSRSLPRDIEMVATLDGVIHDLVFVRQCLRAEMPPDTEISPAERREMEGWPR